MHVKKRLTARLECALVAAAAAALITFAGCAAKDVKPEYSRVLKSWTRTTKIYDGLEPKLYISATFKLGEFRSAYIDRYAWSYRLDEGYAGGMRARELELAERYNEFFFSAYTPDESWNDFDKLDSVWRLYLVDSSGARLSPVSIVRVDVSNPLLREFFPYVDLWSQAYIARFPRYSESGTEPIPSESTEFVKLLVVGVLGEGELEWRLTGR